MEKFISIIVPVYNVEKYLEKCLNSILCQDYREYEVLLIDDGSTDNSPMICDDFSRKYKNIRVRAKPVWISVERSEVEGSRPSAARENTRNRT